MSDAIAPLISFALLLGALWAGLRRAFPKPTQQVGYAGLRDLSPTSVLGLDDGQLERYGREWAALLCDGANWVIRRKETLTLLDASTFRRNTSIDFEVPRTLTSDGIPGYANGKVLVPVLCLEKAQATLTRFDFADESRSSLPLPTRHENGMVSAFILVAAAEKALAQPPSSALVHDLTALAVLEPQQAELYLSRVLGDGALTSRERLHREPLSRNETFSWLVHTLTYSCVVVVAVDPSPPPVRHIVKLSFDQQIDDRRDLGWLSPAPFGQSLGWDPLSIVVDSPFIGAQSYHFEAEVTPSIEILDAYLMTSFKHDFIELNRVVARDPRVHVYVAEAAEAAEGQASVAQIRFRVQRQTFLAGALVASALVSVVLGVCVAFSSHIAEESSSFAGLLVAFPSAVVAYVLRGTGHDLATRLVWKARAVLFVAGLMPLVAGGRLAADRVSDAYHPEASALLAWWIPALCVAVVATLLLAYAVVVPRAPKRSANLAERFQFAPEDFQ